jgi:hypothetical protein
VLGFRTAPLDEGNNAPTVDAAGQQFKDTRIAHGTRITFALQAQFLIIDRPGAVGRQDQLKVNRFLCHGGHRRDIRDEDAQQRRHKREHQMSHALTPSRDQSSPD